MPSALATREVLYIFLYASPFFFFWNFGKLSQEGRRGQGVSILCTASWKQETMHACMLSHFSRVQLFVNPWSVTHHITLFMAFSRQEYWSGSPCLPPRDLPDPRSNPGSDRTKGLCSSHSGTISTGGKKSNLMSV